MPKSDHFLNRSVSPLRQALMQSCAKGKYEAQYQIYAGICTIKQTKTNSRLSNKMAETNVPNKAEPKTILVVLRFSSTID